MSSRTILKLGSIDPSYTKELTVPTLYTSDVVQASGVSLPVIQSGVSTCQAAQLEIQVAPYLNASNVAVWANYFSTNSEGLSTSMKNVSTLEVTGAPGQPFSWLTAGF